MRALRTQHVTIAHICTCTASALLLQVRNSQLDKEAGELRHENAQLQRECEKLRTDEASGARVCCQP